MMGRERILVALGALAGFSGVAAASAAAHVTGGGTLQTAANFLLFHAPVLLALAALLATGLVHRIAGLVAGVLLALGLTLFCGDLSVRALYGIAPLRMAAPIGGILLLGGWLTLALAALWPRRA